MKKNIKLYNMILPPYLLVVFTPWIAVASLVGNFIIDSIVLLFVSLFVLQKIDGKSFIKKVFLVWGLGFAADFVGLFYLFAGSHLGYFYINSFIPKDIENPGFVYSLMSGMNDVTNHAYNVTPYSIGFLISAVVLSAVAIFLLDYLIAFRKSELSKKQRVLSALAFAVLTAPYTFLIPNSFFYG